MTNDSLPLAELLAKAGDGDFLRSVAEAVLQLLMETDVEGLIGAGRHARSGERTHPARSRRCQTLRHVADQLRAKWPKLGAFIDESETDVLAHMDFPAQHRSKIHSTNSLERLNKEVKRRADVVGIFPNEQAIIRLIGAVLLESNDEWQLQHCYMQVEPMAELTPTLIEAIAPQLSTAVE